MSPYKLSSRSARQATLVRLDDIEIGGPQVVIMAGPCSIESRDQLLATARRLAAMGVRILRGGAFKPRTSPYAFQGLGEEGLKLLAEARDETGMKVVTEVMSPDKIDLVSHYADILQVGARNMQNFDLLRGCAKAGKPILLKRGLSATIDEWLQAAEYILAGNPDVILCERGIRTFETATRNTLDLAAIPVLRDRTHLPIVVDPSHATGVRAYVGPMARASIAAGADGLLIEVHPDPEKALCDGPQSLTPDQLEMLLRDLQTIAPVVHRSLPLSHSPTLSLSHSAVAFQGERGAFSERAALAALGAVATLPCRGFRDVFEAVSSGAAALGIVPIENTLGGSIHANYDLLLEHDLHIVGETTLRIVHNLIAHPGVAISDIRRVYAHPQAAAQCERFLRGHPEWTVYQVYDTAGSVKMIRDENARDAAAIAGLAAADGMSVLREAIESDPRNYTRFILISRTPVDGDKATLTIETKHEPGALHAALDSFARRGLNLTKLESRPIPGRPWEYRFTLDVVGALSDDVLVGLRESCARVVLHGRYPGR